MTGTFTLAHISDVHLAPIQGFHPRFWNVKRSLGYLNWLRTRRFIHDASVASRIAVDALAHGPDHVAVTGDLANLGLPGEYEVAYRWLQSLGTPDMVTVVPGNHDIYTARMHGASCLEHWAAFMGSNEAGATLLGAERDPFPFVRVHKGIALIGVNSAMPTPPFVAAGRVGERQRALLANALDACRNAGLVRIILIHHPPLNGLAPPRRALQDAPHLERILEEHGAELVLHGHNHEDMLSWRQWKHGHVPVIGVGSGSARRVHHKEPPARYNLIRVTGRGSQAAIDVRVRGLVYPEEEIRDIAHHKISRS